MKKTYLYSVVALLLFLSNSIARALCTASSSVNTVKVDLSGKDLRQVGPEIFGFDAAFPEFQSGYVTDAKIDTKLIDYLKPFKGAFYRYPGGNYFQWENSILPLKERRPNSTEFLGYLVPEFGLGEYLEFLKMVDGRGIFQLNLLGNQGKNSTPVKIAQNNQALLEWVKKHPEGPRLTHWELGNELDWGKHNLNAQEYISVAKPTYDALSKYSNTHIIVSGKTNPWKFGVEVEENYNREVVKAASFSGISLHAYYDGFPIPMMEEAIKRYAATGLTKEKPFKVYITEHGRWPTEKSGGKWEDNWYQASGSLGAISSADFMIMSISMPQVATAIWHGLGVHGPWQLIHIDRKNKILYPSATYWALRTIREGFLPTSVPVVTRIIEPNSAKVSYAGGYSTRSIAMTDTKGKWSVLGVNRSNSNVRFDISLEDGADFANVNIIQTKLDEKGADNTDSNHNLIGMEYKSPQKIQTKEFSFCAEPFSVFSLIFTTDINPKH